MSTTWICHKILPVLSLTTSARFATHVNALMKKIFKTAQGEICLSSEWLYSTNAFGKSHKIHQQKEFTKNSELKGK